MLVHRYPALVPASQPETSVRISSPMWRRLLTSPLLPPGSAVLVAGGRPLDATDLLVDLAYDVTGLCEDPEAVIAGRLACPKADFHLWRPLASQLPVSRHFDLILAVDLSSHLGNLNGFTARLETARLMSAVKPGARLVSLSPAPPSTGHHLGCWKRHFAGFPGEVSAEVLTDGWRRWLPWRTLKMLGPLPPVLSVTWTAPAEHRSLAYWQERARGGLKTGTRICCDAASATTERAAPVRRAA